LDFWLCLHRRAPDRTVRAEHTTVARLRFKLFPTAFADIEMLAASVGIYSIVWCPHSGQVITDVLVMDGVA